jgi:hypothetical protein
VEVSLAETIDTDPGKSKAGEIQTVAFVEVGLFAAGIAISTSKILEAEKFPNNVVEIAVVILLFIAAEKLIIFLFTVPALPSLYAPFTSKLAEASGVDVLIPTFENVFVPAKVWVVVFTTPLAVALASGIFKVMLPPKDAGEPAVLILVPDVPRFSDIVPKPDAETGIQFVPFH